MSRQTCLLVKAISKSKNLLLLIDVIQNILLRQDSNIQAYKIRLLEKIFSLDASQLILLKILQDTDWHPYFLAILQEENSLASFFIAKFKQYCASEDDA